MQGSKSAEIFRKKKKNSLASRAERGETAAEKREQNVLGQASLFKKTKQNTATDWTGPSLLQQEKLVLSNLKRWQSLPARNYATVVDITSVSLSHLDKYLYAKQVHYKGWQQKSGSVQLTKAAM